MLAVRRRLAQERVTHAAATMSTTSARDLLNVCALGPCTGRSQRGVRGLQKAVHDDISIYTNASPPTRGVPQQPLGDNGESPPFDGFRRLGPSDKI